MKEWNEIVRRKALYCVKNHPNLTALQISELIGEEVTTVRPRLSDLKNKEHLVRWNGVVRAIVKGKKRLCSEHKWVSV
jgi:hypothetical protein